MITGKEAIIMSVDEARVLLNALDIMSWTKKKIEELQKNGSFTVIDQLKDTVRSYNQSKLIGE
jgi:hypothetical protein